MCFARAAAYMGVTAFFALFAFVYEHFSHYVFSYYILLAFVAPFAGAVFYQLTGLIEKAPVPGRFMNFCVDAAVATFALGMITKGAVEIYGTDNSLIPVFFYVGAGFVLTGAITFMIMILRNKRKRGQI